MDSHRERGLLGWHPVLRVVLWLAFALGGMLGCGFGLGRLFEKYYQSFAGGMFIGGFLGLTIFGPLAFNFLLRRDKDANDFSSLM